MNASSKQRREKILAEVFERRHVSAKDLAVRMDVSEATVRRDLKLLAEAGQIEVVYGGATLRRSSDSSSRAADAQNIPAKRLIGSLAANLIGDNEQVFLDSGTTCFEMAPFLKRRRQLSIIVNSTRLALELEAPGLSVILLGGQYRPDRMDTVGPLATSTLDQLRGYVCFIGSDGLGMEFGLAAADIENASLYRLAVRHARRTVLLVDHTKFVNPSLYKIVDWDSIQTLVTDQSPPSDWIEFLEAHDIEMIYPGEHALTTTATNNRSTNHA